VQRFTGAIVLRGSSPLERFSALRSVLTDLSLSAAAAAERILAATSSATPVFVVADEEAFDEGSRNVVEILASAHHGTWLFPHDGEPLPGSRWFVVSPRLAGRRALEGRVASRAWLEEFVASPQFGGYLAHGDVPPASAPLPMLTEPVRSYIGALALLGTRIPIPLATSFLAEFLFRAPLAELAVAGVAAIDGDCFTFVSDALREEAARLVPATSRGAICRVAASRAEGVQAALLWIEAGDVARATAVLEATQWSGPEEIVAALRRLPPSMLTPVLAQRYAHALIDCGRYRDARDLVVGDELVLARAERRTGDYGPALARLERMERRPFDAGLLRGEILRLLDRHSDAAAALSDCEPATGEEEIRLAYERAVLAFEARNEVDATWLRPHYLASRFSTYVALARGEYAEAARLARESHEQARCTTERIDASLDQLFAVFSSGAWDEARAVAVEALQEVEETQGDRAAGGILFTLAYLAADNGQWAHAAQRVTRLKHYYSGTNDEVRLAELQLLHSHLDFCRGRFADARRSAEALFTTRRTHDQIREAAALILDEIDWIEGVRGPLRSTGRSGNAELTRRHRRIAARDATQIEETIAGELFAFRRACGAGDQATAQEIANRFDLFFEPAPAPEESELRVLRAAALRDFPFAAADFDRPWCFATRNRLGQWHSIGSRQVSADVLDELSDDSAHDWISCSERELLFIEGSSAWSSEGREAVAALFRTRADNQRLRRVLEQEEQAQPPRSGIGAIEGIVGESAAMREIDALISRIARRDVPVCILGESGTGKELVARAIHRLSQRRPKPFTAVNCAALPENLIESELFGHVRGAFTGADRDRAGLIETTDGGTLFLDEIGEMPLTAQAKLLRFLQEGEFRRVGDTVNRSADVRIVSATNRKLEAAVEEGRFRDDLYYRVRGVEALLPPLRERGGDVVLLASHFLAAERGKHRSGPVSLAPDVEAIFGAYAWPGNVRELQNTIRAAHAMAGDSKTIELEHLPERLRNVAPARVAAGSYQDAVTRFKRDLIERSLLQVQGNQNRAAAMLKISRQALAYQIRELGIMVGRSRNADR
jgi:two-component system NtrC family response regulator